MNLGTIQTALTSWVETFSGLPVEWGRMPQKLHTGPFVLAYLGPIVKLGHDERIQTYGDDGDNTTVRVVGVRRMTLRLSFRSFDQRLGGSARQYAENFRARAHWTSSFDYLRTSDLALIDTSDLVEADYEWSGRMVSQVELSTTLGLRASFADPLHDGSYIGTVTEPQAEEIIVDEYGVPVLDINSDNLVPE